MAASAATGRHYRLGIASRAVIAVLGSYVLAVLVSMATAASFAGVIGGRDAAGLGQMIGFLLYAGAVIWAFACSSAARAWAGIGAASALGAAWLILARAGA